MTVARRVGSVHLALAGTINAATGLLVLALSLSGWLLTAAITEGSRFATPATVLENGDLLGTLATWVAPVVGVLLLAVAAAQFYCGYHAYAGRHSEWGVVTAVVGGVNLLALPVGLIAAVLLGVAE